MPYELEGEEEEVKVVSGRRACGCEDCWNHSPSGISTVHVDPKLSSFSGKANIKFKISRVYVSLFNPHNIQHLIHMIVFHILPLALAEKKNCVS